MITNKDEYLEAFQHLSKIEKAIENNDDFLLAILITQLKYKYNLRLQVETLEAFTVRTEGGVTVIL